MKVKVTQDFRDRTEDLKLRKKGQTLEVSKDRAAILEGLGLAKQIQEKSAEEKAATEQAEESTEKADSAE